jgi:hypothetical protein
VDYENVYYVDNRNASPVMVDHRTGARLPSRTTSVIHAVPSGHITQSSGWHPAAAAPYASYAPQAFYPVNPGYVSSPPFAPTNNLTSILGGFGDIGSLTNIIAQAFAAFMPLPAAPQPVDPPSEGDGSMSAATNSSNLIRYQNALAQYAKRDQQILTLGTVLKELFKRPGMVIG